MLFTIYSEGSALGGFPAEQGGTLALKMERKMIDTVRISSMVDDVDLTQFDKEIRSVDQKTGEIKSRFVTTSGVRLTFFPVEKTGRLLAEVSIPKLVKGNNYELITDGELEEGLQKIQSRLWEVSDSPKIEKWHVSRMDSVMSWVLGNRKEEYIKYFRSLGLHGYVTTAYTSNKTEIGTSWIAYSRRVNAYDKDKETNINLGGVLRLEVQDRNSSSVRTMCKRLKVGQTAGELINNQVARSEVKRFMDRVKMQVFINSSEDILDQLTAGRGQRGAELFFFYSGYKKYGDKFRTMAGYADSTWFRMKKEIQGIKEDSQKTKNIELEV